MHSGCSVTVTCLTWDQVTPGSNPGTPTDKTNVREEYPI